MFCPENNKEKILGPITLNKGKNAFARHANVDAYVAMQKVRNAHKPHTVGLLVFNSAADMICLTLPKSAVSNDAAHVRVPPQLRMSSSKLNEILTDQESCSEITVYDTARVIAHEILNLHIRNEPQFFYNSGHEAMSRNHLLYLGSTMGNGHHAARPRPYGKHYHWVGIRIEHNKFNNDSVIYREPRWISPNHLLASDKALAMSSRKREMIEDAVLVYSRITGEHNKLARTVLQVRQQKAA